MTPVVEVEKLGVVLGGLPILRDIHLIVQPGEAVALLGGNGSGKTTLIRAVLGLTPVAFGRAELFGRPVPSFREWSRVGYVPQRAQVSLHTTTVSELVMSGLLATRRLFVPLSRAQRTRVAETLGRVGLGDRGNDSFVHLSGGQQQRALIARALVGQPELLVLDEPFAGVDFESQESVSALLAELKADGVAILVVLHELGPLLPIIDRAVVLRAGRVIAEGDPAQVTRNGHHDHLPPAGSAPILGSQADMSASWTS